MRRLLVLALLAAACARAPRDWSVTAADGHTEADRLLDQGDRAGAKRVLESILEGAPDRGGTETRRVLVQDTRFRLARLALDAHDPALAARHADAGLALGGGADLFVANLLVARGAAHEALGQSAQALSVYQRALR